MFIGTRVITTTCGRDRFHCPSCGPGMPYRHRRVRRVITLFSIPTVPLRRLGEYVECLECGGTFKTSVFGYDPEGERREFLSEYQRVIVRVMVEMMLADGESDPEEVETIREMYGKLAGESISAAQVREAVARARAEGAGLEAYLRRMAGQLNEKGKELVVVAAFMVAAADEQLDDEEMTLLERVGWALEMEPAHYRGLIASFLRGES